MGLFPASAIRSGFYLWFPVIDLVQTLGFVAGTIFTPADMLKLTFPDADSSDPGTLKLMQMFGFAILSLCGAEALMLLLGVKAMVYWMRFQTGFMLVFYYLWFVFSPAFFFSPMNLPTVPLICLYVYAGFVHYRWWKIPLVDGYSAVDTEEKGFMAY
mmetsp:Transcript_11268/g.27546  ORF Transcript_11268/g.27546 Transcript_11268/m.27546 type:complete len:157 (-) Transcript_11268:418-888(-)|eukprot:g3203.t1